MTLGSARSAVVVGLRNSDYWRTPDEKQHREERLLRERQRYLELKADVMDRKLENRMTSLQQKILRQEYLELPPGAVAPRVSSCA